MMIMSLFYFISMYSYGSLEVILLCEVFHKVGSAGLAHGARALLQDHRSAAGGGDRERGSVPARQFPERQATEERLRS